jgi:hypothetical protein
MQVRRGTIGLALLSALTITGAGLINSSHTPTRSVAMGGCYDSVGHTVPAGNFANMTDGHTYYCQEDPNGFDYWVDMGLTGPTEPGGGGGKHLPLQA